MNNKIDKIKKVHLIGICGAGMSALAVLLKESGWEVTGSDDYILGPIPLYLKKKKITVYEKYDVKNIPKGVDLVIVGNNIPLSLEENPEKARAVESGIKIQSMPETLALLSENTENIVVIGSSGKSSMTAIIAWCLVKGKIDPSYFIGAISPDLKGSSHLGKGKDFVLEGDEYTSSKTDSRSKFLHFNPSSLVLTSTSHDHINIFPTEESYKEPFKKMVAKIPKNGLLVYAKNGKNNSEIAKNAVCRTVSYGLDNKADWYAENISYSLKSSFDLMHRGEKIIGIETELLGKHNIENIVGVGALLLETKKITRGIFAKAIVSFHGIKNRIELKNKNAVVPVYVGFGSSYEKARSIFDAMRLHFPTRRLITVFEPHSFSWRNRKFLNWYKDVFDNVDEVVMLPAASYGKKAKDQLTTAQVWREAKKHTHIHVAKDAEKVLKILDKILKKDDVVALVSSGSLFGLADSIPKLIEKKFPKKTI
jgi:UDP-N-acetylmuramate: L-alanyl-gamma-D-glutamyl-meso-diaminopimelate ligase